jgi:hypothetical protein
MRILGAVLPLGVPVAFLYSAVPQVTDDTPRVMRYQRHRVVAAESLEIPVFLTSGGVDDEPAVAEAAAVDEEPAVEGPLTESLRLIGTVGGPPWRAVISAEQGGRGLATVGISDTLAGYTIVWINRDSVVLEKQERRIVLSLRESWQ